MIHLVLLSGGSGTRLWPLSNSTRSKQFLKVLRDADGNHVSMVQRVFGQIGSVDRIIAYVSRFITLKMGDLIYTGTPVGVGPVQPGDRLTASLEGYTLLDFDIH